MNAIHVKIGSPNETDRIPPIPRNEIVDFQLLRQIASDAREKDFEAMLHATKPAKRRTVSRGFAR